MNTISQLKKATLAVALLSVLAVSTAFAQEPQPVVESKPPGKEAYQVTLDRQLPAGVVISNFHLPQPPAGKRLVIEYVSVTAFLNQNQTAFANLGITSPMTAGSANAVRISFPLTNPFRSSLGGDYRTFSAPVRVYVDPGSMFVFGMHRTTAPYAGDVSVTIIGYLIDMPQQ